MGPLRPVTKYQQLHSEAMHCAKCPAAPPGPQQLLNNCAPLAVCSPRAPLTGLRVPSGHMAGDRRRALPALLALVCLLAAAAGAVVQAQATETAALLALKAAVSGSSNALAGWTAGADPCSPTAGWQGVNCTAGRVTSV